MLCDTGAQEPDTRALVVEDEQPNPPVSFITSSLDWKQEKVGSHLHAHRRALTQGFIIITNPLLC